MIIKTETELNVARIFCNEPFSYFSISELVDKAGISRTWAYRVLGKFRRFDMLLENRKSYKFDFSNIICKRLKLFFDSEFITSLSLKERIINIADRIIYECKPVSIILVGSVAVEKERKTSDIDFLIISSKKSKKEVPLVKENVNMILMNIDEFEKRYFKGDDFIISSLSFGRIIYDREYFIGFYQKPLPAFSDEIIQEKLDYCRKLRDRVYALLRSDVDSARKELLNLLLQCARVILLKNRVIPPTKHEVADAVKEYNKELAEVLGHLMRDEKIGKKKMVEYLRVCEEII